MNISGPALTIAGEPFLVPLAIPYVAGPSALATLLLLMSREPQRWPEWLLVAVAVQMFIEGLRIALRP